MEREQLYALITQQLIDDGYQKVADQLVASGVKVAGDHTPKQQLLRLFNRKLGEQIPSEDHRLLMQCGGGEERKELGLQDDYVTRFIAVCKDPVVCAGFSPAGDYAAIASEDCSVRVLEVDKMQTNIEVKGERPGEYDSTNPVYKIIYDHARVIFFF
jgi:WD40 repeat protein